MAINEIRELLENQRVAPPYEFDSDRKDREEMPYLLHYLSAVQSMGEVSNLIQVNASSYNYVSPGEMEVKIMKVMEDLAMMATKYEEEYKEPQLSLRH